MEDADKTTNRAAARKFMVDHDTLSYSNNAMKISAEGNKIVATATD